MCLVDLIYTSCIFKGNNALLCVRYSRSLDFLCTPLCYTVILHVLHYTVSKFWVCCVAVVYPAGEHVGTPLYTFLTIPITIGYQPTMGPIPGITYPSMNYPLILSRGRQIFSVLI